MNIQVDIERISRGWSGASVARVVAMEAVADRLNAMARLAGARQHAVLKTGTLGAKGSVPAILDTSGDTSAADSACGPALAGRIVAHMTQSMTPLVNVGGGVPACLRSFATGLPGTAGPDLIVLPVKLGGGSEGAVILTGDALELDVAIVLDLHRRAHDVFKALLSLEIERSAPRQNLNDRELECLQLAGEGLKSELIAKQLTLSVHTVNAYLSAATAKLDSVNRIQAIAKAIRLGYLA